MHIILALLFTITFDHTVYAAIDPQLEGTWKSVSGRSRVEFRDNSYTFTEICQLNEAQNLEATVTVPADASNGKVTTFARGSSIIKSLDGKLCNTYVEARTHLYKVNGDRLSFGINAKYMGEFVR